MNSSGARTRFFSIVMLIFVAMLGPAAGGERGIALGVTKAMRAALVEGDGVSVYEGLPHSMWEGEVFEKEAKREDTTNFFGHRFYTPESPAKSPKIEEIKKLLGGTGGIRVWEGEKECGGFHPDYAVRRKHENHTVVAMVCFGCAEVIYTQGGKKFRYDLSVAGLKGLRKILSGFRSKRPKTDYFDGHVGPADGGPNP